MFEYLSSLPIIYWQRRKVVVSEKNFQQGASEVTLNLLFYINYHHEKSPTMSPEFASKSAS